MGQPSICHIFHILSHHQCTGRRKGGSLLGKSRNQGRFWSPEVLIWSFIGQSDKKVHLPMPNDRPVKSKIGKSQWPSSNSNSIPDHFNKFEFDKKNKSQVNLVTLEVIWQRGGARKEGGLKCKKVLRKVAGLPLDTPNRVRPGLMWLTHHYHGFHLFFQNTARGNFYISGGKVKILKKEIQIQKIVKEKSKTQSRRTFLQWIFRRKNRKCKTRNNSNSASPSYLSMQTTAAYFSHYSFQPFIKNKIHINL